MSETFRVPEVAVNAPRGSRRKRSTISIASRDDGGEYRNWSANGDMFWVSKQNYDAIPAGSYRCNIIDGLGPVFVRENSDSDDLLEIPDSVCAAILDEIEAFWGLKAQFEARGFLHKRGVMLYGPPGTGKTATVRQLTNMIVRDYGGIAALVNNPAVASECFKMVRRIEPNRPIIALLEDLDSLVDNFGTMAFLSLLDGEAQVGNIVFVATTNLPEELDNRFMDRPSRFDAVMYVGPPSAAARRFYLLAKEPSLREDGIEEWVRRSEGLSIAHLRELIILCRCYGKSLATGIERLEKLKQKPTSETFNK